MGGFMQLSFERNEVYECGAALLTILANPQEIDEERSGQLYLSLRQGPLAEALAKSRGLHADYRQAGICVSRPRGY